MKELKKIRKYEVKKNKYKLILIFICKKEEVFLQYESKDPCDFRM